MVGCIERKGRGRFYINIDGVERCVRLTFNYENFHPWWRCKVVHGS